MFSTAGETRIIGYHKLKYGNNMLSRFDRIPERDRQTDGRTDRIAMSIARVDIAVLTRDKNEEKPTAAFL